MNIDETLIPAFKQGCPFEVLTDLMFYIAIQEEYVYKRQNIYHMRANLDFCFRLAYPFTPSSPWAM